MKAKTIIENKIPVFIKHLDNLNRTLKVINKVVYSSGYEETLYNNIKDKLISWELNINLIVDWTRYQRAYSKCKEVGIQQYLEKILEQTERPNDLIEKFKK